jgi:hypothetical protein
MISTNSIESPVKFPYITSDVGHALGRDYWNSVIKMFRYQSLLPAYHISDTNGVVYYRNDLVHSCPVEESVFNKTGKKQFFNSYVEEITPDLSKVTPFFIGKLKDGVLNYRTIQVDKITSDNWIIVQFEPNKYYNIFRYDITALYVGAIPKFRAKSFTAMYSSFDWQSVTVLMEMGLNSELKPMAEVIGELDLRFTEGDYQWLKQQ